jgi:hypothetical protein
MCTLIDEHCHSNCLRVNTAACAIVYDRDVDFGPLYVIESSDDNCDHLTNDGDKLEGVTENFRIRKLS